MARRPVPAPTVACRRCGTPITDEKRTRRRLFCTAYCRLAWWRSQQAA